MTEPGLDPELGEPPAKKRDVDPIAPTEHPWDLPATFSVLQCSCNPEETGEIPIPREANLPIDAEARRVVARVSKAVVAVVGFDGDGDRLTNASGFIVEFDKATRIGTIFSTATVFERNPAFPDVEKIRVYLFDGASYDATVTAYDYHWNLLVLSVSFDRVVQTIELVEISDNHRFGRSILLPPSSREMLCPGDTIIGLGRSSLEPFGLQANRGIYCIERWSANYWYCQEMQIATFLNTIPAIGGPAINNNGRVIGMLFQARTCTPFLPSNIILKWWEYFKEIGKYCRPTISVLGVNLHDAHSSPLVNIPKSLHSGLDGLLVEMVSEAVASEGLQENDLIVRCNGKHVATSLQLFEILASNIGKRVELSVVKSEDGSSRSIYLPVEEVVEENFYLWRIAYYDRGLC